MAAEAELPRNAPSQPLRAQSSPCLLGPSLSRSSSTGSTLDSSPMCRYCFGEGGAGEAQLVSPCACRGSARSVHFKCLVTWVAAGLARKKDRSRQARCEICKHVFFGGTRQHDLLLATASAELQLSKLYSEAQHSAEAVMVDGSSSSSGSGGSTAGTRPLLTLDAALHGYWAVALRPLQAAMLAHQVLSPALLMGPAAAAGAAVAQAVGWAAGRMCDQWVRALAVEGIGRQPVMAAAASFAFASLAGSSLAAWLRGAPAACASLFLRLPLSLPLFPQAAAGLAAFGALFPGTSSASDGLRAAAVGPLLALRWVLSRSGARTRLGWLAAAVCRLVAQLRTAVRPMVAGAH